MKEEETIYIKIIVDNLVSETTKSRHTHLIKGSMGFLIKKASFICDIFGISSYQIKKMLELFDYALEGGEHLCLVCGYPIILKKKHFEISEKPKGLLVVPFELL